MKHLLLACLMAFTATQVMAGEKGNGGGSHFCKNRYRQEMYDLYEGKTRYGLTYRVDIDGEIQTYLDEAIAKIKRRNLSLAIRLQEEIDFLNTEGNFEIMYNLELTPVPDAHILMKNKGCEYKQLANWDEMTNKVFVDQDIYKKLPNFHKAALKMHEAIYSVARKYLDHKNSDLSRRFNAEVWSTSDEMPTINVFEVNIGSDMTFSEEVRETGVTILTSGETAAEINFDFHNVEFNKVEDYSLEVTVEIPEVLKDLNKVPVINEQIEAIRATMPQMSQTTRKGRKDRTEAIFKMERLKREINTIFGNADVLEKFKMGKFTYSFSLEQGHLEKEVVSCSCSEGYFRDGYEHSLNYIVTAKIKYKGKTISEDSVERRTDLSVIDPTHYLHKFDFKMVKRTN